MMTLGEIHGTARTLDDAGCSPVADGASAAWAYPPGAAGVRLPGPVPHLPRFAELFSDDPAFAADAARAVRDLAPGPARTPRSGEADLFGAFLAGYREVRPPPEPDPARLPLFGAAHAACTAVRARSALGDPGHPGDPRWLHALHRKLEHHVQRQRAAAVAFAEESIRA